MEQESRFEIFYSKMSDQLDLVAACEIAAVGETRFSKDDFVSQQELEEIDALREIVAEISSPKYALLTST